MNATRQLSTPALGLACAFALAFSAGWPSTARAQGASAPQSAAAEMTDGEVRKVDKEAGKLTLKHARIKNLDMPGMTMVFGVRDKAMLDAVKAGDQVRFVVVDEGGKFIVTEMQVVK